MRRRRGRLRVGTLIAGLLNVTVLLGCGAVSIPPPDDLFAASRADRGAPTQVRDERRSCGDLDLRSGGEVSTKARACFTDSLAKDDVELALIELTDEGTPVVRFFHTSPHSASYDVHVNATWDKFGGGEWYQVRCNPVSVASDPFRMLNCDLV